MSNIDGIRKKYELVSLFAELCKGNLSILNIEVKKFLSDKSIELSDINMDYSNPYNVSQLKYLIMICNLLYNRSDMIVLPVEDGVYDLLLEKYKSLDPNFQVGSAVVQFKSQAKSKIPNSSEHKQAIFFHEKIERDDIREHFANQLKRFDQNRFDARDLYEEPIYFKEENKYISKKTHDTKHNHPDLVGTLDKVKFVLDQDAIEKGVYDDPKVAILERDFFIKHINKGIITPDQELEMVLELKYDGISVEADCNRVVQSARTRGDTGIGEAADISEILKGYRFKHNNLILSDTIGVKFEAIIKRSALPLFNEMRGYNYANCRTAIIGLFGNSDAYKYQQFITLIPLAIDRDQAPYIKNRMEEIEFINSLFKTKGEPLRYCYIKGNYKTCLFLIKKFVEEAKVARNYLDFAFDGVVVSYLDENIRHRLGRENFINKYSIAVKFDPLSKLTTFLGYTFEVGQDGRICPMIHYAPVEFFGTIHPKSTGSSLKRFNDLALKEGDIIEVTYTNDVMPYVSSIDCEQNRQNKNPKIEFPKLCPACGTPLKINISDSGKTAYCPNFYCIGRRLHTMINMLQKLNIKGFAESFIIRLHVYSLKELFELPKCVVEEEIGPTNADNFEIAINHIKNDPIEDYRIIGSLGFTRCAIQTWKIIFKEMTLNDFIQLMESGDEGMVFAKLSTMKGIGNVTAKNIIDDYQYYRVDIDYIKNFNIINSKDIQTKKQIRFTGCRNKQLEELLNSRGYDANGNASVTKQTDILLVPYAGFKSSKTSKISDHTLVIPIGDFMNDMERYL